MKITKRMEEIRNLHQKIIIAIQYESKETQPIKTDVTEIPLILEKFHSVCNPTYKDNMNVFIFCVLWMYCPMSFISGKLTYGKVRRALSNTLEISSSAVSKKFVIIKSLIFNHKGFRSEVDRVLELLLAS